MKLQWNRLPALALAATSISAPPYAAQAQQTAAAPIEEISVVATRVGRDHDELQNTILDVELDGGRFRSLDEALRHDPAFGLFRRASSLSAHPTTQGATLRGIGPNGAGRALVTLDGIPLNDGFGGWVYWSAIPDQILAGATITHGGGAGPWGNQALSGVIELETKTPDDDGVAARLSGGSHGTLSGAATGTISGDDFALTVYGKYDETDGYFLLDETQRGPVDVPAARQVKAVGAIGTVFLPDQLRVKLGAHYFEEDRVNGLALATNQTDNIGFTFSVRKLVAADQRWKLKAYYRDQGFANAFASARDERTTERQVLDQYDVPSTSWGVSGMWEKASDAGFTARLGFDARGARGETNERFRNLGAGYTRYRLAGGRQILAGAYGEVTRNGRDYELSAMVRFDHWTSSDGVRREVNTETDELVREDVIDDRSGEVLNARLSGLRRLGNGLTARGALYSGFRLPTINEYFRPFRVVNDITEANPNLDPEQVYGFDLGLDKELRDGGELRLTYFRNWLKDGVGNVTIALGPGFYPPTGFVPGGGSLRERQNIDMIVTDGLEMAMDTAVGGGFSLRLGYVYARARVTGVATGQEALDGKRVAQSPRHRGSVALDYDNAGRLRAGIEARFSSSQYEDDLNSRSLEGYLTLNAYAEWQVSEGMALFAAVENALDADIQSAISGTGLITYAQPRIAQAGVRARF